MVVAGMEEFRSIVYRHCAAINANNNNLIKPSPNSI